MTLKEAFRNAISNKITNEDNDFLYHMPFHSDDTYLEILSDELEGTFFFGIFALIGRQNFTAQGALKLFNTLKDIPTERIYFSSIPIEGESTEALAELIAMQPNLKQITLRCHLNNNDRQVLKGAAEIREIDIYFLPILEHDDDAKEDSISVSTTSTENPTPYDHDPRTGGSKRQLLATHYRSGLVKKHPHTLPRKSFFSRLSSFWYKVPDTQIPSVEPASHDQNEGPITLPGSMKSLN